MFVNIGTCKGLGNYYWIFFEVKASISLITNLLKGKTMRHITLKMLQLVVTSVCSPQDWLYFLTYLRRTNF